MLDIRELAYQIINQLRTICHLCVNSNCFFLAQTIANQIKHVTKEHAEEETLSRSLIVSSLFEKRDHPDIKAFLDMIRLATPVQLQPANIY